MKLHELIKRYRPCLDDEPIGLKRSWEEVFRYTLKVYPADTPLEHFDLQTLTSRLTEAGLHRLLVDGYVKRWKELLAKADTL